MPFTIVKVSNGWKLKKKKTGEFTKRVFKTRRAAKSMADNWEAHDRRLGRLSHRRAVARRSRR